ncbi:hypothetical protein AJ79_00615 [Helicocarpus griseus UAMH5409]|uniref:Phthiocerol/phthiodiolone dimycocerosyl transferase C-terminal domain-containing protein n=1 Tax=Helicocarpus griseus UAMH5409 TaxID=1447875 RepID=A0A2B7Y9S3_9EURO|nr:hypothetical protein AJ79_00615 [Helicocarpus griseus UAMH5409]
MSWNEVSLGTWQRQLDELEIILKRVADPYKPIGREHWALNIRALLRFDNSVSQQRILAGLRRAWVRTRYHHPFIAARLRGDDHIYEVPSDETKLETWLRESVVIEESKSIAEYWLTAPSMEYSCLLYFPRSSEILLRVHHWTIDGMGGVHFLDRFLTYLSTDRPAPSFGTEHLRLPPPYIEAAGLPATSSVPAKAAACDAFTSFVSEMPSTGLPALPVPTPGGTKVFRLSSPPTTLSSLLAATRNHNLGFAAAVQSAIIQATRQRAPEPLAKRPFSTTTFLDHRKYLKPPYIDTGAWPMSVYMMALPTTQPEADFMTTAKNMQTVLKQDLTVGKSFVTEWYPEFCSLYAELMTRPLPEGMVPPTQPQLISIGSMDEIVKTRYGNRKEKGEREGNALVVEVKEVEPVLDNMKEQVVVFQWSFGGRWWLNACYNERFCEEVVVQGFLRRVREILFAELGVEETE